MSIRYSVVDEVGVIFHNSIQKCKMRLFQVSVVPRHELTRTIDFVRRRCIIAISSFFSSAAKQKIGDAIARPADDLFDDDALLEELEGLEEADLEEQLLAPPSVPTSRPAAPQVAESKVPDYELPSVPAGAPVATPVSAPIDEDEDARALRELEASMAM